MSYSITGNKSLVKSVTTAFLPARVFVPLCQEKGVSCESVVLDGSRVEEGQVIAEPQSSDSFYGARIHSPIPGRVMGTRICTFPNGKCGDALEIALAGEFSHIGKKSQEIDWKTFGKNSLLNRIGAHGVINTFSMREPTSLAGDIHSIMDAIRPRDRQSLSSVKIFVRLYDEDSSCHTDRVLADSQFDRIISAVRILCEIISPKEVVFAYAKNGDALIERLLSLKDEDDRFRFVAMNHKKFPCGTKHDIIERYKKNMRLSDSKREICGESLFVDCETLSTLYDAVVYNIPVTRVNVSVSGNCLKSSAVLKVCVGTSFKSIAEELGLEKDSIGKIIVNGSRNGFAVSSLETPITKYVKSVEFVSHHDAANFSVAYCTGCGKCRASCPAQICPDIILSHISGVEVPSEFVRAAELCVECGLCNCVCPVKLPLFQSVKILKERQNGNK